MKIASILSLVSVVLAAPMQYEEEVINPFTLPWSAVNGIGIPIFVMNWNHHVAKYISRERPGPITKESMKVCSPLFVTQKATIGSLFPSPIGSSTIQTLTIIPPDTFKSRIMSSPDIPIKPPHKPSYK